MAKRSGKDQSFAKGYGNTPRKTQPDLNHLVLAHTASPVDPMVVVLPARLHLIGVPGSMVHNADAQSIKLLNGKTVYTSQHFDTCTFEEYMLCPVASIF
jgi:hypothetical protein